MKPSTRVIYRGAVHEVLETGERFDEPWLYVCPVWGDMRGPPRWVPAKHTRERPAIDRRAPAEEAR